MILGKIMMKILDQSRLRYTFSYKLVHRAFGPCERTTLIMITLIMITLIMTNDLTNPDIRVDETMQGIGEPKV